MTVVPGRSISLRKPAKAIDDGGWTPGKLTIKARGNLVERNGKTVFRIAGSGEEFEVILEHKHKLDRSGSGVTTVTGEVGLEGTRATLKIHEVSIEP